jgi:ferredoxin-NADP reductase
VPEPAPGPIPWQTARVVSIRAETARAKTFRLALAGPSGHRAGQHYVVRLTAPDGYTASRSYSVASAPDGSPEFELTVERLDDGEVSPWFVDVAQAGDTFDVRGPFGGWFVWDAAHGGPLLLIAGGSGLVPLMSMLRHRRNAASNAEARLLLSARDPGDVLYGDELHTIGADVRFTYTRHAPGDWTGYTRRVDREMLREVAYAPDAGARTYVCGPTAFVETVANDLVALGHDPANIRTERFGATGG